MSWIDSFELFLFDFDGLLVNTEELHFEAYKRCASAYGLDLDWDMDEYGRHAYFSATGLKEGIRKKFPKTFDTDEAWAIFYSEKKKAYITLIEGGEAKLMPGAASLLQRLASLGKKKCVVTNSTRAMIDPIRDQIQALGLVDYWITREDYSEPKPSPEGYQKAIDSFLTEGKVIGFEDTVKGLKALLKTKATAILVSKNNPLNSSACAGMDQELKDLSLKKGAIWSASLSDLLAGSQLSSPFS